MSAPKIRKRKAPTLHREDWEPLRGRIVKLYADEDRPLREVKSIIEGELGFRAEIRQYRECISNWNLDKNIKSEVMGCIVRKRQRRKLVEVEKNQLRFRLRSRLVDPSKIDRWMKRHNVMESMLYTPHPIAPTPSALSYRTMTDSDLPTLSHADVSIPGRNDQILNWIRSQALLRDFPAPTSVSMTFVEDSSWIDPEAASWMTNSVPSLGQPITGYTITFESPRESPSIFTTYGTCSETTPPRDTEQGIYHQYVEDAALLKSHFDHAGRNNPHIYGVEHDESIGMVNSRALNADGTQSLHPILAREYRSGCNWLTTQRT